VPEGGDLVERHLRPLAGEPLICRGLRALGVEDRERINAAQGLQSVCVRDGTIRLSACVGEVPLTFQIVDVSVTMSDEDEPRPTRVQAPAP
jgi:hypothetical protein